MADRFIPGSSPIDDAPVVLRKPFRLHLAVDALPAAGSRTVEGASGRPGLWPACACVPVSASPYLPPPSAREAFPPPWDISPWPRAERDLNPPETCAARHTLCAAQTARSPLGGVRCSLSFPAPVGRASGFVSLARARLVCEAGAASPRRESAPRWSALLGLLCPQGDQGRSQGPASPL